MHLDDTPRLEAVTERDIDVLLMEEFESGSGFLEWFIGATASWSTSGLDLLGVWHSVSNEHGESDLLVLTHRDNERLALLIENKVDAPPQPDQAVRYQRRGELGVSQGVWQQYATCVIAPSRYLGAGANAAGYQARVSYEDIAEWIRINSPPGRRTEFKRNLILGAIEQQRRGYSPVVDPVVTRFFTEYWEFAASLFPELGFSHRDARGADSTWAEFRPATLTKARRILHKMPEGHIDLEFPGFGERTDELVTRNAPLLIEGLKFVRTQKSASLRIDVPKMDVREQFTAQREGALAALKAAFRLTTVASLVRTE